MTPKVTIPTMPTPREVAVELGPGESGVALVSLSGYCRPISIDEGYQVYRRVLTIQSVAFLFANLLKCEINIPYAFIFKNWLLEREDMRVEMKHVAWEKLEHMYGYQVKR